MHPGHETSTLHAGAGQPASRSAGVLLEGPDVLACRLLAVGDDAFLHKLQASIHDAGLVVKFQGVSDYLMALGQASHVRPEVVIGQWSLLGTQERSILAGLRRLAPEAKLCLTAEASQTSQAMLALESGFDAVLPMPVTSEQLKAIFSPHRSASPQPPATAGSTSSSAGASAQPSADPWTDWGASPAAAAPSPDTRPRRTSPLSAASTASTTGTGIDPYDSADSELGDVDLIDALLAKPMAFRAMILDLVRGRSGLAGVALAEDAQSVPAEHAGVWVMYRQARLGVLHAPPPVTKAQLVPWAGWLGHWLALESRSQSLWEMAHRDELSGAWNRRYFDRHLSRVLAQAAQKRFPVTLLVFDIDDFKTYNDRYGHAAGDEILRETVKLMKSVVREHDVVARIGGDEFAVIFWDPHGPRKPNSSHPDDVRAAARRFQQAICTHRFPKLHEQAPGRLTISGGLASFPWDGATPEALLERADTMLLHSKDQGKNVITLGVGAQRSGDPYSP